MSTTALGQDQLTSELQSLPEWKPDGDVITKTFTFGSFREAISFMVRVGFEAEQRDHHPDWSNVYNKVEIRLSTHDADGKVTAKDIELARAIEHVNWVK